MHYRLHNLHLGTELIYETLRHLKARKRQNTKDTIKLIEWNRKMHSSLIVYKYKSYLLYELILIFTKTEENRLFHGQTGNYHYFINTRSELFIHFNGMSNLFMFVVYTWPTKQWSESKTMCRWWRFQRTMNVHCAIVIIIIICRLN